MTDTEREICRLASKGCSPETIWAILFSGTETDTAVVDVATVYNRHASTIAQMRLVWSAGQRAKNATRDCVEV